EPPGEGVVDGSQSRGLPTSLLESHRESLLRVPISGNVRSLNLSVSVGITLYEAWRQSGWRTAGDAGKAESPV
ncbi:MAG: TrmH family RNA methyltransferase, partial [Thermogutta sp.]